MAKTKRPEAVTAIQREVGQRCRWVLDEVMPNQSELADHLELDASTVNKYVQGHRAQSIFFIRNFARRFRVSTDYLLRGVLTGVEDRNLALRLAAKHPELVLDIGLPEIAEGSPPPRAIRRPKVLKKVAESTEPA